MFVMMSGTVHSSEEETFSDDDRSGVLLLKHQKFVPKVK